MLIACGSPMHGFHRYLKHGMSILWDHFSSSMEEHCSCRSGPGFDSRLKWSVSGKWISQNQLLPIPKRFNFVFADKIWRYLQKDRNRRNSSNLTFIIRYISKCSIRFGSIPPRSSCAIQKRNETTVVFWLPDCLYSSHKQLNPFDTLQQNQEMGTGKPGSRNGMICKWYVMIYKCVDVIFLSRMFFDGLYTAVNLKLLLY